MLKRLLWLWAGVLALILCVGYFPLTPRGQFIGAVIIIVVTLAVWIRGGRSRVAAQVESAINAAWQAHLPAERYRQPVVLVCGDGLAQMFKGAAVRETPEGCYLVVSDLSMLSEASAALLNLRPDWVTQLSTLLLVNPSQHNDMAVLANRVQTFRHQLSRMRRVTGTDVPALLCSYLPMAMTSDVATDNPEWFEFKAGQPSATVWHNAHSAQPLAHWVAQGESAEQTQRLYRAIEVESWVQWMVQQILPQCLTREQSIPVCSPLALALTFSPAVPELSSAHLWQQWLTEKTTLNRKESSSKVSEDVSLPFPDPLLRLLPQQSGFTPRRRAAVYAAGVFTLAGLVALNVSAWQNRTLSRQMTDDLQRYQAIPMSDTQAKAQAVKVLKADAAQLNEYYREGVPLNLGLGLYPGERLRQPVLAAIKGYIPPVEEIKVDEPAPPQVAPQTVLLDSLSLFDTGKYQLKAGSTKVLVEALINIKAKPGWLIVVAGHTDITGDAKANQMLSLKRAESVRDWMLQTSDVSPTCFAVQGYGATRPIASNDTDQGRAANRRVEISLVPQANACQGPGSVTPPEQVGGSDNQGE
ncbi:MULTISPECIES: OmpA family protein [unclassified Serratia (in: enterobacteria)]|uniref:OmpA family protein n=1 Tax=unclassified Serratia (in: enterobacteria) TaxID=2647522 RepID=UPI000B315E79|nr:MULTISPECIES: OmpA family protein [unclassified Serratia (in: enterobacteria)]